MIDVRLKLRNLLFYLILKIDNARSDIDQDGESSLLRRIIKKHTGTNLVLFDIGANVGGYVSTALEILQEVDKQKEMSVHAFEPLPTTFSQLKTNLGNNSNCKLINAGASDTNGNTTIFYNPAYSGLTSLHNRAEVDLPSQMDISLTRLDYYMDENKISVIDFLKIDTEGHELSVLKGVGNYLNPKIIKAIQFEYGGTYLDSRTYLKDVYTLLTSKGYEIYKLYPNTIKLRQYHPAMENFQYSNFVALDPSAFNTLIS
jgi:FkbM family methyltransferase